MERQTTEFMWSLLTRTPVVLITIVGIVWAVVQWRKASSAALWTTLACVGLLLSSCVFPAMFAYVSPIVARNAPPDEHLAYIIWTNRAIITAWNFCTAICLAMLILAAFSGRATPTRLDDERRYTPHDDDTIRQDPPPPSAGDERFKAP